MAEEHTHKDPEATRAEIRKVIDFARSLDLYGVFILGTHCKACGRIVDYQIVSDLGGDERGSSGTYVAEMLRDMARVVERSDGEPVGPTPPNQNH